MDERSTTIIEPEVDTNYKVDEQGRIIPLSDEHRRARTEKILKMLERLAAIPDDDNCSDEAFMRAMDEDRPERPLFREYYEP